MSRRLKIILVVILLMGLGGFLGFQKLNSDLDNLRDNQFDTLVPSQWKDGIYLGEAKQFPITVKVEVVIQSNEITKITILEHQSGEGQGAEVIVDEVIRAQSLDVDAITGATYSSILILEAIEEAIKKAYE